MMMMRLATVLLLPALCSAKAWQLLHSLDSGKTFSERGTVSLSLNDEGQVDISIEHADSCLDLDAVNSISDSGLYQVKLIKDDATEILTSVPACQVRRANFRDELSVTLNGHAEAVSLSYTPLVSPLAPKCTELEKMTDAPSFITSVSFETATRGMTIPTLLPQTKPPAGLKFFPRSQGAQSIPGVKGQEEKGPQSFLYKYWYILLPLVVMGLTGGGGEEEAAPQEGGSAGKEAAPAAAGSASAAAASKQRRGKRS